MAEDEVIIKIKGEIEDFKKSLNEAKNTIQQFSTESKNSLISGFNIKDMITSLIGFDIIKSSFNAIVGFVKSSFAEFAEGELVAKRLEAAFRATGLGTKEDAKSLIDYAGQLQKVTRFSDDAIVKMMSFLATFKMTGPEIKKATPVILDLAEALEIDLRTAAMLVGKAFTGEYGTLSRYGIIIDENRVKSEGFAYVLDLLKEKFGGFATEVGETTAGKLDKLKNAWGDFKEAFGKVVIAPVATPILKFLTDILNPETYKNISKEIPIDLMVPEFNEASDAVQRFNDVGANVDLSNLQNQLDDTANKVDKNIQKWTNYENFIKSHPEMFGYTEEASKPKLYFESEVLSKSIQDYWAKAVMSDKEYALWKEAQRRDELLLEAKTAKEKEMIWQAYYANVKKIEEDFAEKTEKTIKNSIKRTWAMAELVGPSNIGLEELRGAFTYNTIKKIEIEVKGSNKKINANDTDAAIKIGKAVLAMAGGM